MRCLDCRSKMNRMAGGEYQCPACLKILDHAELTATYRPVLRVGIIVILILTALTKLNTLVAVPTVLFGMFLLRCAKRCGTAMAKVQGLLTLACMGVSGYWLVSRVLEIAYIILHMPKL